MKTYEYHKNSHSARTFPLLRLHKTVNFHYHSYLHHSTKHLYLRQYTLAHLYKITLANQKIFLLHITVLTPASLIPITIYIHLYIHTHTHYYIRKIFKVQFCYWGFRWNKKPWEKETIMVKIIANKYQQLFLIFIYSFLFFIYLFIYSFTLYYFLFLSKHHYFHLYK